MSKIIQVIKFSLSSVIGFAVDYLLFLLMFRLTGVKALSNVTARVFSSAVNFTINKKLVFKSDEGLFKAAVKYFALAAFILTVNTALLEIICALTHIDVRIAKIIVECVMFIFSLTVQKLFVFKATKKEP